MLWLNVIAFIFLLSFFLFLVRGGKPALAFGTCCLSLVVSVVFSSLAGAIQSILLFVTLVFFCIPLLRPVQFVVTSALSTVLSAAVLFTIGTSASLSSKWPVSVNGLMSSDPADVPPFSQSVSGESLSDVWLLDPNSPGWNDQPLRLRNLHAAQITHFVNSPGFGMVRMAFRRDEYKGISIPDLGTRTGPSLSAESRNGSHSDRPGPIESGSATTDFESRWLGDSLPQWDVKTVELVGLLKHDRPRVYVNDRAPQLHVKGDSGTRALDPFEEGGLRAILKGDILHTRFEGDGLRMVGAIRAAKQCVDCHGGSRGDLLGAFSYRLKK